MKHVLLTGFVAVVALASYGSIAAPAGDGGRRGRGRVDAQAFAWRKSALEARPQRWRQIDGLRVKLSCPGDRAASATASLFLSGGAAAEVRAEAVDPTVTTDDGHPKRVLAPGPLRSSAAKRSRGRPVSFTFVASRLPGSHAAVVRLLWRSPSKEALRLVSGSLRVTWDRAAGACR